jgi:O-antigen/teichoic acid export membrane protein
VLNNRSFLKHALIFGSASLLTQAAGILLIPLFTRCLSKEEYGALEILVRAGEVAAIFLLVSGLKQGLMTHYQQKDSDAERKRTVSAALVLLLIASVVVGGVIFLSERVIAEKLRLESNLLALAVAAVVLEPFHLLPLALMQARLESTRFVATTVCHFLTRVLLSVLFVTRFHWGVAGVLGATALTGAIFAALLVGRELWRGLAWPDWERVRGLMLFALPFLPTSICFFILQNGDRFVLQRLHGNAEVATYSLGYKLAQAVGTFSLAPLYMVWGAHLYSVARTEGAPVVFGRAFTRILTAFLFVGLGVSVFEVEAVALLGGGAYGSAVTVIAPVLLASFFQSAASLMDAAFYIRHRTGQKLLVTLAATILMAALYVLWIPPYASMGAAFATLVGFAFLVLCTWKVTQRMFPVAYEWSRMGGIVLLAGTFWLLSRPLPATPWLLPLKAALWLAWPMLLWHLGLVSANEKRYVLLLLRRPFGAARAVFSFGRART